MENESLALGLLRDSSKRNKRTFAVLLIVIFLWFATIVSFVWYINQFDYVTEYTNSTNNGGNACIGDNCINGDSMEKK